MVHTLPILGGLVLFCAGYATARIEDPRRARSVAVGVFTSVGLLLAWPILACAWSPSGVARIEVAGFELATSGDTLRGMAMIVDILVGLLAVALAPLATHRARTIGAIVKIIGVAIAFLALEHPIALAALWAITIVIVHGELVHENSDVARVFRRYQIPSIVFAVTGSALMLLGFPGAGSVSWLLGIAIREAVIPVHGWLPRMIDRAPLGLVVALIAPQLGIHVHLTAIDPALSLDVTHAFATMASLTAIGAAVLGLVQADARRAVGWIVISQTGLVAFGLESHSEIGLAGAVLTWQVMALATSGFIMVIAALEARRGQLSLRVPGGSFERTPRMAVAFLVLGFASVGLPASLGFVAEDLLVQGTVDEYPALALSVIVATALNGMNVARSFFALFSGTNRHIGERDLTRLETFAVTVVIGALFAAGTCPGILVDGLAR